LQSESCAVHGWDPETNTTSGDESGEQLWGSVVTIKSIGVEPGISFSPLRDADLDELVETIGIWEGWYRYMRLCHAGY
jgi:hypothetical protein